MRMATKRKRWFVTAGATAAVAIGVWAAVAMATPGNVSAPALTNAPVVSWTESAGPATAYDLQRADGACPGTSFATVGSTGSGVLSRADTPPNDGTFCYRVVGHYGDPDAPETSADTAQVVFDATAPAVPMFSSPAAGATLHSPITVAAGSSDSSGVALKSLTISVVNGATLVSVLGANQASTQWTPADGSYVLRAVAVDRADNASETTIPVTVDSTPPPAFQIIAPASVPGGPTLSWSLPGGPYTFTITRDGAAVDPPVVTSPWTDLGNPAPGLHSYVVTATDTAGNTASASANVLVTPPSATQPRQLSASSPTNAVPHLTWLPPVTFAVTSWQVYRDGVALPPITDAATTSFDDATVGAQGAHLYSVQALDNGRPGDMSTSITVTYDTLAPAFGAVTATPNVDGSVALSWPDAADASPGSGLSKYIVRRGAQTTPPADPSSGTGICTVTLPAPTGCVDSAAVSGSIYGYSVFAIDAAGNLTRQVTSARALDSLPPDPVSGFRAAVGPTNAHLEWNVPARQGKDADLAGYRIIKLGTGIKQPTNPRDGTEVCPGLGFDDGDCFVQSLSTRTPVTFAIYAMDASNNFSAPTTLTVTPSSSDHKKPGLPKKVKIKRVGAKITMTWVSPKDRDLSKFRVTLFNKGPAKRPSLGKAIVTGRVLHASFKLEAGQVVYVNLFAIDLSGNYSRVTRLIVMPDKLFEPKSKHKKAAKKKAPGTKTPPKKQKKN
jgi:hypothetical protein